MHIATIMCFKYHYCHYNSSSQSEKQQQATNNYTKSAALEVGPQVSSLIKVKKKQL